MRVYRGMGDELTPGAPTKVTIKNPDGTSREITATYVTAGPEVVTKPKFQLPGWVIPVAAGAGGILVLGFVFSRIGGGRSYAGYRRTRRSRRSRR